MTRLIDVDANRNAEKWSRKELAGRLLWDLLRVPLFAWSPRQLWVWRRIMLRVFGAKIGSRTRIHPTVSIAIPWKVEIGDHVGIGDKVILYSLGRIKIGNDVTISQHAHLCAGTHAYDDISFPLQKPPITIEDAVWIAADAFVGPNTSVGAGAIVAARSVVVRDVEARTIVAGNPATLVSTRDQNEYTS